MNAFRLSIRTCTFLGMVFLVGLVAGCGRSPGSISGKVTYNGKPLKGGNVAFHSTEGQPSVGAEIGEDGTYSIPAIPAGSYKICVDTDSLRPASKSGPGGGSAKYGSGNMPMPNAPKQGPPPESKMKADLKIPEGVHPSSPADMQAAKAGKRFVEIPLSYAKPDTTDLTYTVVGGAQTHDIELK